MSKTHTNKAIQNGGFAQYTFDLNDNIGGLPARIPLNNTKDGDCQNDSNMYIGGAKYRKNRKTNNKSHNSHTRKSSKFRKSNNAYKSRKSKNAYKSRNSHKSRKSHKSRNSHT